MFLEIHERFLVNDPAGLKNVAFDLSFHGRKDSATLYAGAKKNDVRTRGLYGYDDP